MSGNITIPAAAIEAGAIELAPHPWSMYTEAAQDHFRGKARAAFLAMIEAWEGAKTVHDDGRRQTYIIPAIILPLPTEDSDGK